MIKIINTGEVENANGSIVMHKYELFINNNRVCEFTHHRPDGLAECLRAAALAVERKSIDEVVSFLSDMFSADKGGK